MADRYMVFVPGSPNPPQGPFSLEELRAALAASKLPPEARVSTVGNTTWVPITEVVPPAVVVPEPSTTEPLAAVDALAPPPPVGSMATAAPVQPQNVVASPKAE